jgi:lysophospholipase L1-like esterase
VAVAACVLGAACGSKSPGPSGPTTPNPPQISCPADVTVSGVAAPSQTVSYGAPTTTEGSPPVNVICSPASGASFPLGTTSVNCAANDAIARQATCSFKVTLKGNTLAATRFAAYGDSLTQGEVGRPSFDGFNEIDTPNAYPTKLQAAFDATYPGQGSVVINRGRGGDLVEGPPSETKTTLNVIIQNVAADKPDAVLLLSGYNNLNPCGPDHSTTQACREAISDVPIGLRDCIRKTHELSPATKYIFLSTLTPPASSGSNRIDPSAIIQTNVGIRNLAAGERVVLVDSYAAFVGHEAEYVNVDGLHLKPAGYQALADTFFAAIQKTIPQTPLFAPTAPR